jgi:hypothetical protein
MTCLSLGANLAAAKQPAVSVRDFSPAAINVVEIGPVPAAVAGLTAGVEPVALAFDVLAGLHIAAARNAAGPIPIPVVIAISISISIPITIMIVPVATTAAKLAIDVDDTAATPVKIVEPSPNPAAVAGLAPGAEDVAVHVDRRAGLNVRSASLPRSPSALEPAIVVHDFAHAAIDIVQGCPYPTSAYRLASGV